MFDPRMDLAATGGPTSAVSLAKRQGVEPGRSQQRSNWA